MSVQTLFIASAILTKPDLIDKGAEADVLQVLQGKVVPLKKGYTIVRCRGQSDINENVSLAEATRQEKEFFASHTHFGYYVAFNLVDIQLSVILCNVQSHLRVFLLPPVIFLKSRGPQHPAWPPDSLKSWLNISRQV